MLKKGMYVRCQYDREYPNDPRVFYMGQVVSIDDFAGTVNVRFLDPFKFGKYYPVPEKEITYPQIHVSRCTLFRDSFIKIGSQKCKVVAIDGKEDDLYTYYVMNDLSREVFSCPENKIIAPFTNGRISPKQQLLHYEFQNPCWYFGRSIVNTTMRTLDNSIMGFKELAGCKIFLLPHQLQTVMRCLQQEKCRVMLADEVGMGKTIEAASIIKLYIQKKSDKEILIIVPSALLEQWKVELFIKFGLIDGDNENGNGIQFCSIDDLDEELLSISWNMIVVDEAHRTLSDQSKYKKIHGLSKNAEHVLLLSATPIQQKSEDYLRLLQLLDPAHYDGFKKKKFEQLMELQGKLVNHLVGIIDNAEDYSEIIHEKMDGSDNDSEEEDELYEDILDGLKSVCLIIEDDKFNEIVGEINRDTKDYGLRKIQSAIAYLCNNYQIERNIIRNRRRILDQDEYEGQTRPIRNLYEEIIYEMNEETEYAVYQELTNWFILYGITKESIKKLIRPLISCFFSSASSFIAKLKDVEKSGTDVPVELQQITERWQAEEEDSLAHLEEALEDPDGHTSRLIRVIDYCDQNLFDKKVVLFTAHKETFDLYAKAFKKMYDEESYCLFNSGIKADELELSVYRFQNDSKCHMLLSDESGGEGRNFQCADYIINVDLPWDANLIEQRIGRLDRLERDPNRPEVNIVVIHTQDTIEEQLFNFWNNGLNLFSESLSGLEIMLEDIDNEIENALQSDYRYGIFNAIESIVESTKKTKEQLRREQLYDTASYEYKPMNNEIRRLVRYYNKNENALFTDAMMTWASLAGFRNAGRSHNIAEFAEDDFSLNSAANTMLIPPKWQEYLGNRRVSFGAEVEEQFLIKKEKKNTSHDIRRIKGTFDRKSAIENDYLHFFAPGDDIFDCIVTNALHSCKGQVAAFAAKATFDWRGFIYTYSFSPNEQLMIENNLSTYTLAEYRNYISLELINIPVAFSEFQEISDEQVLKEYQKIIRAGYKNKRAYDHFGKRGKGSGILDISMKYRVSNIEWFRNKYPYEKWEDLVEESEKIAKEKAIKLFRRKTRLKEAKEEMDRSIASRAASDKYYGKKKEKTVSLEEQYELIMECLKKARVRLEAACYIWMMK